MGKLKGWLGMLPERKDALVPKIPQPLVKKRLEQGCENSFVLKYLQGQIFQMILIFIRILPKHLFFYIISSGFMLMLLI